MHLPAAFLIAGMLGLAAAPIAPAQRTAEADGHTVTYRVNGAGGPTIVLISGLGETMSSFDVLAADLARTNTVVAYDRAGYGESGAASSARDAEAADRELVAILARSGAAAPYVLVGHSSGGLYAEHFAARHPDLVAGVILEDARPAGFTRACEAARLGMCVATPLMMTFSSKGAKAEAAALAAAAAQVEALSPPAHVPVLVVSRALGRKPSAWEALWAREQAKLSARYPLGRHVTAPAGGHNLHHDQPEWFAGAVRVFLAQDAKAKPRVEAGS